MPPAEAFIQLADEHQAGVRGDARSLKRDLQETVEGELKRLGFSLTHRVSPFVAGFLVSEPRKIKARRLFCGVGSRRDQSEIRDNSTIVHNDYGGTFGNTYNEDPTNLADRNGYQ